jgi:hypothetical protein
VASTLLITPRGSSAVWRWTGSVSTAWYTEYRATAIRGAVIRFRAADVERVVRGTRRWQRERHAVHTGRARVSRGSERGQTSGYGE